MRVCKGCNKEYELSESGAGYKYCSQECSDEARRIRNRERWREANPGWDEGTNKVCEWCGKKFIVPDRNAHIARFCSDECRNTWRSREIKGHRPIEEHLKERKKQKKERQARLEEEREQQLSNLKCIECGSIFKGTSLHQKTCSLECGRVRKRRQQRLSKDKRINETNNIDKDISVETLYKRDKGVCYICGGKCDINDKYEANGYFTVGPNYPSIDHIIPLARGGMHAWDNVKLAHHLCNSKKCDVLPSEFFDCPIEVNVNEAYALARKISPRKKQVKQFTRDGKLIAVYESTAEAERMTGFKQRGIQDCARGEAKSHRGYVWLY